MPRVSEWRDKYKEEGLRVVAVHMPRYPADQDLDAVREAISEFNITEACAIDNDHKLRDAFQNEQGYVPAYYLFDSEGKLRSFAAGEIRHSWPAEAARPPWASVFSCRRAVANQKTTAAVPCRLPLPW